MKNIRKRAPLWFVCVLCMIIAAALAMISLPSSVFADEQEGVLTYRIDGTNAIITGCDTSATDEDVADAFDEICSPGGIRTTTIAAIGYGAFQKCVKLTEVELPIGLMSIDSIAFFGCTGLTNINIPDSVTNIGSWVFSSCISLTSANIPNSITSINAFQGCTSLTSIIIPNSVTNIGNSAFSGCESLTGIDIPNSVTSIDEYAFENCSGLVSVNIPDSVETIGDRAFYGCSGLASISIPYSVTNIGYAAFSACHMLDTITLDPLNTYFVNDTLGALLDSTQTLLIKVPATHTGEYTIPNSVTTIDEGAFYGCSNLTNVTIPDGVTSISDIAFMYCTGLASIDIPGGVTSIGHSTFMNCTGLKNINIPDSVTNIGNQAFSACTGLINIKVPYGVTSIGDNTFYGCSGLTNVTIPDSITNIGRMAFQACTNLTNINIPAGVVAIDDSAFSYCTGLISATISDSVTSVGALAFGHCASLSEIIIEHGMTNLPTYFLTEETFRDDLRLYVPTSVISVGGQPSFSFSLPANTTMSGRPTIYGVEGSFINAWARANAGNGAKLTEINGTVTKFDYGNAWLNVPYQYIIETMMPDNVELKFNLTVDSDPLPNGLELMQVDDVYDGLMMLSGQFYGAPLETGDFIFTVEVRSKVYNYLLDTQEITLHVDSPSDAVLTGTVNDYDITTSIGAIDLDGAYWVTVFEDQVYEIADADLDGDGLIERNFPDFVHFWIDGKVLVRDTDYNADEGSTVVTVYAKTFQALDDGAVHTASAEFSTKGVQTVAAQNFRVNLPEPEQQPDPEPAPEEKPNPEPDPEPEQKPGPDPEPGPNTDPDPEQKPDPEPNTEPDPEPGPEQNEPEPGPEQNEPEPGPDQNTPLPGGISGGGYTASASARPGTEPNNPVALQTPADTDAADETRVAPAVAPEAATTEAEDTIAAGGDTNPAGTVGASTIDGLPRDENGLFYFVLDGSGAPLEARIDIPLADFADMYFDGELWALGKDYAVREGSTVIIIAAEKLAGLAYGLHEISARFTEDRTVSFAFDLRGPDPASGAEAGPIAPAEETANAALALAAGSGIPAAPFVIAALATILLIAAALVLRARRLKQRSVK